MQCARARRALATDPLLERLVRPVGEVERRLGNLALPPGAPPPARVLRAATGQLGGVGGGSIATAACPLRRRRVQRAGVCAAVWCRVPRLSGRTRLSRLLPAPHGPGGSALRAVPGEQVRSYSFAFSHALSDSKFFAGDLNDPCASSPPLFTCYVVPLSEGCRAPLDLSKLAAPEADYRFALAKPHLRDLTKGSVDATLLSYLLRPNAAFARHLCARLTPGQDHARRPCRLRLSFPSHPSFPQKPPLCACLPRVRVRATSRSPLCALSQVPRHAALWCSSP